MYKLRTVSLGPHRGREWYLTVFVEPRPTETTRFDLEHDATNWGCAIHFKPVQPTATHVEVARIDTTHGQPHFDRLYLPKQPTEWLGQEFTFEDARRTLLSNWRTYVDCWLDNHGSEKA